MESCYLSFQYSAWNLGLTVLCLTPSLNSSYLLQNPGLPHQSPPIPSLISANCTQTEALISRRKAWRKLGDSGKAVRHEVKSRPYKLTKSRRNVMSEMIEAIYLINLMSTVPSKIRNCIQYKYNIRIGSHVRKTKLVD